MTDADAEVVLLILKRGDRGELRISRSRFQGRVFTKAQIWYPTDSGELKPGKQVVTFRDHELAEVIGVLQKIAAKVGAQPARDERPKQQRSRAAAAPETNPPVDLEEALRSF